MGLKSQTWRCIARWALVVPVCASSFIAAFIFLYVAVVLVPRSSIRLADALSLHLPPRIYLALLDIITFGLGFGILIVPTLFAIGFALRIPVADRLRWAASVSLLLTAVYVWFTKALGYTVAPHVAAVASVAVLLGGIVWSLLPARKPERHSLANAVALVVLTVPCWIALAESPSQPPTAPRLWSVALQKGTWAAMNTGSSFASTRQAVFAGDRILVVFDAGSSGYVGKEPMSNYRLLSLDAKNGSVKNSKEFTGHWGAMPYLYATDDGHVIFVNGSLTSLNPDLTPAGPHFVPDRGRIIQMSPDGSTLAWETNPGTSLLDSRTLASKGNHLDESVPTSVSSQAVVTDNHYRYGQYPHDSSFVTLVDEGGERLLFHGDCGGRPEFLTDEKVLLVGCDKIRILDVEGGISRETRTSEGRGTFAGVSQNGRRFALQFSDERGDPSVLLYEHFIIYDTESLRPRSMVRISSLPEQQSWSAFSPDGHSFLAGSPDELSLYELP